MFISLLDVPMRQESKVWVFGDNPTLTMVKRQKRMKKFMYVVFYRSTGFGHQVGRTENSNSKLVYQNILVYRCSRNSPRKMHLPIQPDQQLCFFNKNKF